MSDDQNPAPRSDDHTRAGSDAPAAPPAADAAPSAPEFAAPAHDTPPAPAYGVPAAPASAAPAAPTAYGAPAYDTPAAPAYGAPAYGAPGPGYGAPVPTNVLAIISLVASIAGFLMILPLIGPIAGVVTGHISLAQIKRTGEKGRGMALAGTIIGWVSIAIAVVLIIVLSIAFAIAVNSSSRYGA